MAGNASLSLKPQFAVKCSHESASPSNHSAARHSMNDSAKTMSTPPPENDDEATTSCGEERLQQQAAPEEEMQWAGELIDKVGGALKRSNYDHFTIDARQV